MTELLYLEDNYLKEFKAEVLKTVSTKSNYVILDKTAFYPEGGGQPSDKGFLQVNGKKVNVLKVKKKGPILHKIDSEIEKGAKVHGKINWDLRHTYMKMHTAQHLISRIILNEFGAKTVGNQIHKDFSRLDFYPANFTQENLKQIESKSNNLIKEEIPVKIYEQKRSEIEKTNEGRSNLELIPKHIDPLRVVEIENFDICPCAGTHIKNLKEIGQIKILKKENKGTDKQRLSFSIF